MKTLIDGRRSRRKNEMFSNHFWLIRIKAYVSPSYRNISAHERAYKRLLCAACVCVFAKINYCFLKDLEYILCKDEKSHL